MKLVQFPDYHDSIFFSVNSGEGQGELLLSFKLTNGECRNLILFDCDLFRIIDFTSQNIVSRLMLLHGSEIDFNYVKDKLFWASSLSDSSSYLTEEKCVNLASQIRESQMSLFLLEPSAGAEIVALCCEIKDEKV